MDRRPRVLVVTPDFPPAVGGIQTLVHRVVSEFQDVEPYVVAVGHHGAPAFDARSGVRAVRTATRGRSHGLDVLALNALRQAARVGGNPM